jgi:hypothetical protein
VPFPKPPRVPPPPGAFLSAYRPGATLSAYRHIGFVLRELGETEDEERDLWRDLLRRYRERGAVAGPLSPLGLNAQALIAVVGHPAPPAPPSAIPPTNAGPLGLNAQALIAAVGPPAPPAPPAAIPPTNFDGDVIDDDGDDDGDDDDDDDGDEIGDGIDRRVAAVPHVFAGYTTAGELFKYGSDDDGDEIGDGIDRRVAAVPHVFARRRYNYGSDEQVPGAEFRSGEGSDEEEHDTKRQKSCWR